MRAQISPPAPRNAVLYAMLAACSLILVLAPRAAEASREARLFRAQEEWAEMMDRHEDGQRDVADIDRLFVRAASLMSVRAASLEDMHVNA